MPTSDCIRESSDRLRNTRNRIARQQRLVDAAEFKPLEFAYAIRHLKVMQASLAALEVSHAILLGLVDSEAAPANPKDDLVHAKVSGPSPVDVWTVEDDVIRYAARGTIAPESLSLREIKDVCLALVAERAKPPR